MAVYLYYTVYFNVAENRATQTERQLFEMPTGRVRRECVSDRTVLCPRFVRLVEQDMRLKRRTTPVPDPVVSSARRPTLADSL